MAVEPSQFFEVNPSDPVFQNLKDKVVLITGASSGIGLATAKFVLSQGAKVAVCDMNPCPLTEGSIYFEKVDVRDWVQQREFFKGAYKKYGKIDHVFANAGISGVDSFCEDKLDADGELEPPNMKTMDINLTACIYTCKLGAYYIRKNENVGGSLVMTASGSSFAPFILTDYGVAKHGVLGLMRNLQQNFIDTPIRSNCIAPSWTATGLVPSQLLKDRLNITVQSADTAAHSVALLMADPERNGQTMFSKQGRLKEVDRMLMGTMMQFNEFGEGDGPKGMNQKQFFDTMAGIKAT